MIELETARLTLTDWGEDAVDNLMVMHNDPEVQRYLDPHRLGWTRDKAAYRLAGWIEERLQLGLGKYPVIRKADGAFVGRAGFSLYEGEPEIGYSFGRPHWGQGYATEIAGALRDWFFANRPEPSFIGFAHVDNAGSRRVLEKIGMRPTHEAPVLGMPHQFYVLERP